VPSPPRRIRIDFASYPKGAAIADHHRFCRLDVVDITFFYFLFFSLSFLFFSFELIYDAAPASSLYRVVVILMPVS
jgi:hypothetical protein